MAKQPEAAVFGDMVIAVHIIMAFYKSVFKDAKWDLWRKVKTEGQSMDSKYSTSGSTWYLFFGKFMINGHPWNCFSKFLCSAISSKLTFFSCSTIMHKMRPSCILELFNVLFSWILKLLQCSINQQQHETGTEDGIS